MKFGSGKESNCHSRFKCLLPLVSWMQYLIFNIIINSKVVLSYIFSSSHHEQFYKTSYITVRCLSSTTFTIERRFYSLSDMPLIWQHKTNKGMWISFWHSLFHLKFGIIPWTLKGWHLWPSTINSWFFFFLPKTTMFSTRKSASVMDGQ